MIYFDNAATTMVKPRCVIEAVTQAMQHMGNSGRGTHGASLGAARTIYDTRKLLADFFNAEKATRIAFTANSTESLNIAIKGLFAPGDHVISTVLEHNSVLRPLYELEKKGVRVTYAECDEKGAIRPEDILKYVDSSTRGIVCTHASNLTGNMIDIARVGAAARKAGIIFVVDASQTAGVIPIDVQEMNIDVLCFTGHKGLLGPQGTGGLYVREGVEIRPLLSGGSGVQTYSREHPREMPTALEAGTLNGHGIAGLHAAVEYIMETGIDNIRSAERELMLRFYNGAKEIPGVRIYGDFDTEERCPIVTLNLRDYDSGEVSDELAFGYEIATRPGGHCAPMMHRALGTVSQGAVRFSFSSFNTADEVDTALDALRELAGGED